jgi:hypothetical protein
MLYVLNFDCLCVIIACGIYAYFKSVLFNAHPMVSHFFINESSHLSYDIVRLVRGSIFKKQGIIGSDD